MNIFETATRKKLRFASGKGDLTVEQLWDLPLIITSPTRDVKADLDSVGQIILSDLKRLGESSLVKTSPDPRVADLEVKLEIVKHIIAAKQAEDADQVRRAAQRNERRRLVEALADKENDEIKNLSKEEILKRLEAFDG